MPGMRRHILYACALALLSGTCLSAQQYLPDKFGSWQAGPTASALPSPGSGVGEDLTGTTGKDHEILLEGKALRNEHRVYVSGKSQLVVTLLALRDPSSAYEVYTYLLAPGMTPSDLGQSSYVSHDRAIILIANLVALVDSLQNASLGDLRDLVEHLRSKADRTPLPPVRTYLPAQGRVLGSERYALGPHAFREALAALDQRGSMGLVDAAGFSAGAEAMIARYSDRNKTAGVLLLLEYPTPQLAEQHLHHLEQALPAAAKQAGTVIERKGSVLSLVLSPSSPAFAEALRKAVNYETQVTWNEPSQTLTDPPWSSVLARIFMGTGICILMAFVLGIAFGGVRVLTKRFFPGKVFDRPERMEILQLGLSGKRIDPSDFYERPVYNRAASRASNKN